MVEEFDKVSIVLMVRPSQREMKTVDDSTVIVPSGV